DRKKPGRVFDFDRFDFIEVGVGRAMIEKLREREAEVDEPDPVEVAEHDPLASLLLRGFDQPHLFVKVAPGLTVVDDAIDPGPGLGIDWGAELFLPPKIKWKIGIELRKNYVGQESALFALEQEGELFGANLSAPGPADVAMRADPGLDSALPRPGIGRDDDRAAGVVLRDLRND